MDLRKASVAELADQVNRRDLSARELTQIALDRIDKVNGEINAFVAVNAEGAIAQAAAIDERLARGEAVGPLAGIPIGVKDLEDAAGFTTTHGSPAHADDPPVAEDSPLVARLRASGCVVLGKLNTPEFGFKAETDNAVFGTTRNPWDLTRSPGGSSGGTAAAIASGMVPLATGSDGGGSIRIPSAVCGLTGMKTSLGRVPGGGVEAPGWAHLSTKGPMARRIRDVTLALDSVVGPDPTDLRSLPMPDASWTRSLDDLHAPLKVGWAPTLGYAQVDAEVRAACESALKVLEGLGTEIVEIDPVFDHDPARDWLTLTTVYNLRSLGHHLGTPVGERFDPAIVALLEWGKANISAIDLVRAEDMCHTYNLRLVELFHDVSLILTPTCAGQTPKSGVQGTIDGVESVSWVSFTYPFNMTRSPAGTVTAGFTTDGMPVGLQVVGPQHGDVVVLRLLALLEDALGLDTVAPLA
jgi:Asp-tRNA(Asn)/Glu-tRNA(Gln) amidotransferase A subunit family amidase